MPLRGRDSPRPEGARDPRPAHRDGHATGGAAAGRGHRLAALSGGPSRDGSRAGALRCSRRGRRRGPRRSWASRGSLSTGKYCAPSPGLSSVALDADGRVMLGAWPSGAKLPEKLVSLRQTPDAIIGLDGPPVRRLADEGALLERSALGLLPSGQLVYAWSARATAGAIARALALAGCTYAVPLAGQPAASGFAYLGASPEKASARTCRSRLRSLGWSFRGPALRCPAKRRARRRSGWSVQA